MCAGLWTLLNPLKRAESKEVPFKGLFSTRSLGSKLPICSAVVTLQTSSLSACHKYILLNYKWSINTLDSHTECADHVTSESAVSTDIDGLLMQISLWPMLFCRGQNKDSLGKKPLSLPLSKKDIVSPSDCYSVWWIFINGFFCGGGKKKTHMMLSTN